MRFFFAAIAVFIVFCAHGSDTENLQSIYVNIQTGSGQIVNKNISGLSLKNDYHTWNIEPGKTYSIGIEYVFMLNNKTGLGSGFHLSTINSKYNLSSNGYPVDQGLITSENLTAFVDPNAFYLNPNETYIKLIQANSYDSTIKLNLIEIPLYGNLIFPVTKYLNLVFKAGFELNYIMSQKYSVKGDMKYFIYLPSSVYDGLFLYAEDDISHTLGLYTINTDKSDVKSKSYNKLNVNGLLYLGLDIPVSEKIFLSAGGTYKPGLTNLSKNNNDYIDVFGRTEEDPAFIPNHIHAFKPTKMQQYLFEIGIKYKF